ncbi:MAG: hypothetical protein PHI11_07200 [Gallionella sp.]|nr:hypothetical protein [Gallionella sp.]
MTTTASKRKIYSSLLLAAVTVLLVAQSGAGFVLLLLFWPLFIWASYSAYIILFVPEGRTNQLIRVMIWVVAVALMVGIHHLRYVTTRQNADAIVATIHRYAVTHGKYPATLDEVGINRQQLRDKLGWSGYYCETGTPRFFYKGTYLPFESYHYDFSQNVWKHRSD